jgi:diguanylate cyclase (GGDEF)-like protein
MNKTRKILKVKNLLWRKRYSKYYNEVHEYELYAQKKFSMLNAIVFLIYSAAGCIWNGLFLGSQITGNLLCFCVSLFSMVDYVICSTFLKRHIKYAAMVANIYILLLGKMLLSIDLMWNEMSGGNVSHALLICSLVSTATLSIMPSHYALIITGVVMLDAIECIAAAQEAVMVLNNLVDGIWMAVFCIVMNIVYSKYQYSEFARKDELKLESSKDQLTQLYNRRYMEKYFRMHAKTECTCAIMMLDLENFKEANDIYGHETGDEVLCIVSDILRNNFRNKDCVARLGEEEFAVFLSEIPKNAVTERIRTMLGRFPIVIGGEERVDVSVSIGIAYKNPGELADYSKLCNRADEAMYMAKNLGKGKAVVCAERNMQEVVE